MNTGGILNRVEIMVYSTITSMLSGVNKLRGEPGLSADASIASTGSVSTQGEFQTVQANKFSLSNAWSLVKESVPPLFLWLLLGFAAGFLIGMFQAR